MASYTDEINALADVTSGQTLDEAGGVGHAAVENAQNAAIRAVGGHLDGDYPTVIHQLDDRSWSADVPARTDDQPRIELRGWDDPSDATNGVDTPANIDDLDVWLDMSDYGITAPWTP